MSKELRIQMMENRIVLLMSRGETMNARIVAKLKRQLRKFKGE